MGEFLASVDATHHVALIEVFHGTVVASPSVDDNAAEGTACVEREGKERKGVCQTSDVDSADSVDRVDLGGTRVVLAPFVEANRIVMFQKLKGLLLQLSDLIFMRKTDDREYLFERECLVTGVKPVG